MSVSTPVLGAYVRRLSAYRGRLVYGGMLALVRALLLVPIPLLVGFAIDRAIPDRDTTQLLLFGFGILGLTVLSAVVQIWARYVMASTTKSVLAEIRSEAIDRLLGVSRDFYSTTDIGSLHDQVVTETGRIESGTRTLLDQYLPGVVLVVGISAVLISMNPLLALVTLLFGPLVYAVNRLIGRWVRGRIRENHVAFESFSQGVLAMLRAMDLVRIQSAEKHEKARQVKAIRRLQASGERRSVGFTVYQVSQQSLVAISGASVLIVGGIAVIDGSMTLGDLISFYAGFALLRNPLQGLTSGAPTVIEATQSLRRLHGLLARVDERPYRGSRVIDFDGNVDLTGVTFGYGDRPVIWDIDLALRRGRVTGLVGPNGSGKSTIVNLIVGFYRPDSGDLLADGVAYDELDLVELRRRMGIVPQQPELRNATIWENIVYGRDGIGDEDVALALELAQASEFVAELEHGVHTVIGEEGVFLSGGQRQRVAIARAIVHRPPLLILDEPTNHLDRTSVGAVIAAIRAIETRPAILVVSHRTEVLSGVDETVELLAGRLQSVRAS